MQKSTFLLFGVLCGVVSIAWMSGPVKDAAAAAGITPQAPAAGVASMEAGPASAALASAGPAGIALREIAPAGIAPREIAPAGVAPFNEQILYYVNQFRAQNGQPPLTMNPDMVETAAIHSTAMAKGTVPFGHDNFDLRFKYVAAKLGGINAFAENVAMGVLNAQQVVDGWEHSPGHRKNMLGNYNLTGIATATAGNGTIYFTQIFAHKQ